MTRCSRRAAAFPFPLAALLALGGCGETVNEAGADRAPNGAAAAPAPPGDRPGPGTGPGVTEGGGAPTGIKGVMARLTKGPNSLTPVIGKELNEASPPWEAVRSQTKEYARLAATLGQNDPPKGSKASWTELTSAYSQSAAALDQAAQAKDKEAALAAHGQITKSCMPCHREHRTMGPGRGGMGPPPGFGPPGGPPPK